MAFIEEIKNIKSDKSEWKKFGITMAIILTGIGSYLLWKKNNYVEYIFILAAVFFVSGLILPFLLRPVYKAWMVLSVVMGYVMTRVIMTAIFFLIVTPIGFVAFLTGKKFLDMKLDKNVKSYWIDRNHQREKSDYERQF